MAAPPPDITGTVVRTSGWELAADSDPILGQFVLTR
jgi:hypothetical protein